MVLNSVTLTLGLIWVAFRLPKCPSSSYRTTNKLNSSVNLNIMNSGSEAITHMYGSICDFQLCCILSRFVSKEAQRELVENCNSSWTLKKELRRDALKISKREVSFSSWGGLKSTSSLLRETSQPVVSQQTYFYVFMEEKFPFLFCFVTVLMISELLLKLVQSVSDHYSIYLIDLN